MKSIVALLLSVLSLSAHPHSDTTLQLEDGKLIGLPEEYSPAEFDFENLRLLISGEVIRFPECIESEFNFDLHELLITSSWYHGRRAGSLPPYITLGHKDSYKDNLIISLDNLLPIPVEWGYGSNENQRNCIDEFKLEDT